MSRLPRIDAPGLPQHLIARGNNKSDCFVTDRDRLVYLRYLREAALECRCALHAFVLMTNHVHLLATGWEAGAISRLMQSIGRRYAHYFNHVHGRTGTLYEGRFKSSVVEDDEYFFTLMRYIELNPVRARMVGSPDHYRWSSHRENAGGSPAGILSPHSLYVDLSSTPDARGAVYRGFFDKAIDDATLDLIRNNINKGRPMGSG